MRDKGDAYACRAMRVSPIPEPNAPAARKFPSKSRPGAEVAKGIVVNPTTELDGGKIFRFVFTGEITARSIYAPLFPPDLDANMSELLRDTRLCLYALRALVCANATKGEPGEDSDTHSKGASGV
jgi:hypothetical protein